MKKELQKPKRLYNKKPVPTDTKILKELVIMNKTLSDIRFILDKTWRGIVPEKGE